MDEILDHIDSVESYHSYATMESISDITHCLSELECTGIFGISEATVNDSLDGTECRLCTKCSERIMLPDDDTLEDQWKDAYEKCRDDWKHKLCDTHVETAMNPSTDIMQPLVMAGAGVNQIIPQTDSRVMEIPPPVNLTPEANISVKALARDWTLNTEQARTFKIIASHLVESKPLRMYLDGPGGTGKSRVIHALTDLFRRRNQSRRLRLAAFTGVAAKNIGGTTLHTALCLSLTKKSQMETRLMQTCLRCGTVLTTCL